MQKKTNIEKTIEVDFSMVLLRINEEFAGEYLPKKKLTFFV